MQYTIQEISGKENELNELMEINKRLDKEIMVLRNRVDELQKEYETTKNNNERLMHSKSFFIGQKITYFSRLICKLFK